MRPIAVALLACVLASPALSRSDDFQQPDAGYALQSTGGAPATSTTPVGRVGRNPADPDRWSNNFCQPFVQSDKGLLSLQEPGTNPSTCYFKSVVKSRNCGCSVYVWRDVREVRLPGYAKFAYEEPQNGSTCVGFSYRDVPRQGIDGNGQVVDTSYSEAFCP